MFTKDDYKDHLGQIEKTEIKMRNIYSDCADRVEDEKIKNVFAKLRDDENRHASMVSELAKMLDL